MTQDEKDIEVAALMRERERLWETAQCLTSKIRKACSSYQFLPLVEKGNSPLVERPDGTFSLPVGVTSDGNHTLPRTEDLARWIRERIDARSRIKEIEELLPSWARLERDQDRSQ
ncbi:MAG: hypothetical protein OXB91_14120 [Bryobacterales bacterium]|nr:hypothetical protein [Bryobacterales bacterium]